MASENKQKKYHLNFTHVKSPLSFGDTLVFQIGRMHCDGGTVIDLHSHLNWYELTVVTDGEGVVQTNGASVSVSRGDIFLSFPGDFHGIVSGHEAPLKYDFFAFNTTSPALAAEFEALSGNAMAADRRIFRDERVRYLVADAISEFNQKGEYSEQILRASLEQILLYVLRDFRTISAPRHTAGVGKQEELCYAMMHYIDTHIYTMRGLSDLAEAMRYNYSYLSDVFCKVTSDTLLHYYRTRRLEAAKLLLAEGRLTISEVADLLHYASIYTFSRAFKEAFGKSPAHYRREVQQEREQANREKM